MLNTFFYKHVIEDTKIEQLRNVSINHKIPNSGIVNLSPLLNKAIWNCKVKHLSYY
jgi:hypothetical protein